MEQLLQTICQFEQANIPCQYTITPQGHIIWLNVCAHAGNADFCFDYTIDQPLSIDEIFTRLRHLLPGVVISAINNKLFIDNLKQL